MRSELNEDEKLNIFLLRNIMGCPGPLKIGPLN
jgi:hypothetical protein